jgi:mRNA interferase MazF
VCVALTSNVRLAEMPGNVLLRAELTGLRKDSVANVSQIVTIDRGELRSAVGHISRRQIDSVLTGIDLVLGRER